MILDDKTLNLQPPQTTIQQDQQPIPATKLTNNQILPKSNPIALSPLSLLTLQQQKIKQNDETSLKSGNDDDTKSFNKLNQNNFYSISSCSSSISLANSPVITQQTTQPSPNTLNVTKCESRRSSKNKLKEKNKL